MLIFFCNFAASFVKWKTYIFIISVCYLSIVLECGSFKRREDSNSKCPCIYGRYLRFLWALPQPQYEQVIARIFVVECQS